LLKCLLLFVFLKVMSVPRCAQDGCKYFKHSTQAHEYCCQGCKRGEDHGKACQRLEYCTRTGCNYIRHSSGGHQGHCCGACRLRGEHGPACEKKEPPGNGTSSSSTSKFTSGASGLFSKLPGFSSSAEMSEEDLRKKFNEIDTDKSGWLGWEEMVAALRKFGRSDQEIREEMARIPGGKDCWIDYARFKAMSKPPVKSSWIHGVPGVGIFTSAVGGSLFGNMSGKDLEAFFHKMDVDESGFLDRREIQEALKQMGKSERQIQHTLEELPEEVQLNLKQFKDLVKPKPLLGALMEVMDDVNDGFDSGIAKVPAAPSLPSVPTVSLPEMPAMPTMPAIPGRALFASMGAMTDEQMRKKFDELDIDSSGKLNKIEMAIALRDMGKSAAEIEEELDFMAKPEMEFDDFKEMVRNPHQQEPEYPEEELVQKFTELDTDGSGKLNKIELAIALRDFGKPAGDIEDQLNSLGESELDFEAFKTLVQPKSREEIRLRHKFTEFDLDSSGLLDRMEITIALRDLGLSVQQIKILLEEAMADKQELDFQAFRTMVLSARVQPDADQVEEEEVEAEEADEDEDEQKQQEQGEQEDAAHLAKADPSEMAAMMTDEEPVNL